MIDDILRLYVIKTHKKITIVNFTVLGYHTEINPYYTCTFDYFSENTRYFKNAFTTIFEDAIKNELRVLKILKVKERCQMNLK